MCDIFCLLRQSLSILEVYCWVNIRIWGISLDRSNCRRVLYCRWKFQVEMDKLLNFHSKLQSTKTFYYYKLTNIDIPVLLPMHHLNQDHECGNEHLNNNKNIN